MRHMHYIPIQPLRPLSGSSHPVRFSLPSNVLRIFTNMNQSLVLLKRELMLGGEIANETLAPNSAAIRSETGLTFMEGGWKDGSDCKAPAV